MKQIWAPWRIEYILAPKDGECVFCKIPSDNDDEKNYILYRGEHNFVVLNIYPYNNGHLMIIPYRHASELSDLTPEEMDENGRLVQKSLTLLKEALNPQGFNVGANIGAAAGAGIGEHVHVHIVPRWNGDNNFMPVLGEVRIMPQHLAESYKTLAKSFKNLK